MVLSCHHFQGKIVLLELITFLLFFCKAYDQHLNMILGDAEETVTTVEIDDETYEEIYKVSYPRLSVIQQLSTNI